MDRHDGVKKTRGLHVYLDLSPERAYLRSNYVYVPYLKKDTSRFVSGSTMDAGMLRILPASPHCGVGPAPEILMYGRK
jgi:hypothetical protein